MEKKLLRKNKLLTFQNIPIRLIKIRLYAQIKVARVVVHKILFLEKQKMRIIQIIQLRNKSQIHKDLQKVKKKAHKDR